MSKSTKKSSQKLPPPFAYKLFLVDGKKHTEFPTGVGFPLEMLEKIVEDCKKHKLKKEMVISSFFIPLPKGLHLKEGSFVARNPKFKNEKAKKTHKKAH